MADADLIALVYPFQDDRYGYAEDGIKSNSRSMPPRRPRQQQRQTQQAPQARRGRESTIPPEDREEPSPDELPYLELRFSHPPHTPSGLIFGMDEACDVVLPNIACISRRHIALTYKNQFEDGFYRLVVRDLGSTYGTVVKYDGKGNQRRRGFDWIVDGFRLPNNTDELIVEVDENLKFRIVIAHHDISSPTYVSNVERFREGAANTEALVGALGLESGPATGHKTGARSPVQDVKDPILIRQGLIGKGGFGFVKRYWNVSTGQEYARKQPVETRYSKKDWEKEIKIMNKISHVSRKQLPFGNSCILIYITRKILSNFISGKRSHCISCTWNTCLSETSKLSMPGASFLIKNA